eukprot:CAMPEP_0170526544 /NCGR_PEP_ID=MMETSP0209-20121228/11940_1 /TAXON_ID=665100 ORGANISM="Litonotus pictus, Strain P1" /NCGR_SAMPLE_ID=MMETSP0209 /ASSEMBLY_ACC=CAM_ASM_000301 /LENGTH=124 /DNA_ID=CAMNT_0010816409 /DNA_START=551 /DNA_END=921 /DNA_ORIENTATION=-
MNFIVSLLSLLNLAMNDPDLKSIFLNIILKDLYNDLIRVNYSQQTINHSNNIPNQNIFFILLKAYELEINLNKYLPSLFSDGLKLGVLEEEDSGAYHHSNNTSCMVLEVFNFLTHIFDYDTFIL